MALKSLKQASDTIAEAYGANAGGKGFKFPNFPRLRTGIFTLDVALGGGIPLGCVSLFYGQESCLAGDTKLRYHTVTPDGKIGNAKGGTLKDLYERFHGIPRKGKGAYLRPGNGELTFTVPAVDEEGIVFHNEVFDVVHTGQKKVFQITTTCGLSLKATADHEFSTGTSFKPLDTLSVGDTIEVHTDKRATGVHGSPRYKTRSVKWHHGYGPKTIKSKGHSYIWHIVPEHRLVMEAHLNGLTLDEWVAYLNSGATHLPSGFVFIPQGHHVHHKNEDRTDNRLENLDIIDASAHGRWHAMNSKKNLSFVTHMGEIASIQPCGEEDTYDVKCYAPYNNFIAQGFVTHNCGKTSLALRCVAQFQRKFPDRKVCWIDVENSWDEDWVKLHGVDPEQVYLYKPTTAEEAADIAKELSMSEDAGLIVVDSIAALGSIQQFEKSAEQVVVAGAAKPSTQMLRNIGAGITEHAKAGQVFTTIYINQPRTKIGFSMGNPEFLPGPVMQNFQAFLKLRLTAYPVLKEKIAPLPIYNDTTARIVKKKFPCIRQTSAWQMALYPYTGGTAKNPVKIKPLEINNRHHMKTMLTDQGWLHQPQKGKGWVLEITGEVFKTQDAGVAAAMEDYDGTVEFAVSKLLLLYADEVEAFVAGKKEMTG